MDEPAKDGINSAISVEQMVDSKISPLRWALAMAFYFPFSQVLSIVGSRNPGFPGHVWIIFACQAMAGALFGALAAMAARSVVKAIRC